ncbi:MAG: phosphoribosylamine--glycine ligase [Firmicutes bacterium]|nr:phosphoribosylamine--glycine ligase [Bacillota bacterium]
MDILVIGSGGREHAIVKKLNESKRVRQVYCAPGNAGIAKDAICVNVGVLDKQGILKFLNENKSVTLTMVAPDNPLADGLVNFLTENGHRAFGPTKEASEIESSKIFAKQLMVDNNIPTAGYKKFESGKDSKAYLDTANYPLVIKADGLAYGKGVYICQSKEEALSASDEIFGGKFGEANTKVIAEDFLVGREVSVLAFTDGKTVVPMLSAQDHKRAYDNDEGPNTGGMGAFAPSKFYTKALADICMELIYKPTIEAMNKLGRKFKGVIYFGLMISPNGEPFILEYNARFGDPETQVILPLLKTDLVDIFEAIIEERLDKIQIKWKKGSAITVVLASEGYPENPRKGDKITVGDIKGLTLYHAGTLDKDGETVSNGGRVLALTGAGSTVGKARKKVYKKINNIKFNGMFYRKDIGIKE